MRRTVTAACWTLSLAIAAATPACGDEAAILQHLKRYFETDDPGAQQRLVSDIAADPAFSREKLRGWLHACGLFGPLPPEPQEISAYCSDDRKLAIVVKPPASYDPQRPYPLIYALHGTDGQPEAILAFVERLLGDRAGEFILAAPRDYQQVIVHATMPPSDEHRAALRAIRKHIHVDSDRVFVTGYSRGGHASWTLAMTAADEFAGVMPLAGSFILQEYDTLYDTFLPNATHTRVLGCWGKDDTADQTLVQASAHGGIAGMNRALRAAAERVRLTSFRLLEDTEKGHGNIAPPPDELTALLAASRVRAPARIDHVFRVLEHGTAYWLEPRSASGEGWTDKPVKIEFREGENPLDPPTQRAALARAIRAKLYELHGEIKGQDLRVTRKRLNELIVWFGDGPVDLSQPLRLKLNGQLVFEGVLTPDLGVCLREAARTRDLERLRWAGLRCTSSGKAKPVTP